MFLNSYIPNAPSDVEWDRLKADAMQARFLVVQVSERRYQIGEREFMRIGTLIVPWVKLRPERYAWVPAMKECERLEHEDRAKRHEPVERPPVCTCRHVSGTESSCPVHGIR